MFTPEDNTATAFSNITCIYLLHSRSFEMHTVSTNLEFFNIILRSSRFRSTWEWLFRGQFLTVASKENVHRIQHPGFLRFHRSIFPPKIRTESPTDFALRSQDLFQERSKQNYLFDLDEILTLYTTRQ